MKCQEVDPRQALRDFVMQFPLQKDAAEALDISAVYLSDLLNKRRDVSPKILAKLGLRRVVVK